MGVKDRILNSTRSGLQIRMTVYVTSAVILASAVVLLILAGVIHGDYESMLDERISDNLTSVTRVMEQRLKRVEDAAIAIETVLSEKVEDRRFVDSVLYHSVEALKDLQGVSVVFRKGWIPGVDGYYERYAYHDDDGRVLLGSYVNGDELENDSDWVSSYLEGNANWGQIFVNLLSDHSEICFYAPLNDEDGNRVGMLYSGVLVSNLTSFVTEYKLHNDFDISIYKADGTMIVAPDDYILELAPEDMLIREATIRDIGWKIVLSADKEHIRSRVRYAMSSMLALFVLMFVVIAIAILLTVKYVARPFILKQQFVEKENALMDNEMQLASSAQNDLVPHVFPPFPDRKGIDLSACLLPARKVGGDLYDYFLSGDSLFFCIGDVSGKGVQASLFMSAAHYLFRSMAAGMPVVDVARQMNISLCADNETCRFITLWLGCLDLRSGSLEYVNAGHDTPLLLRRNGLEALPSSENMPLGVSDDAEFISGYIALHPGDILLLYTDGVTESMDAAGIELGRDSLNQAVLASAGSGDIDASGVIDCVLDRVRRHASGTDQSDDITMLCLKYIENEVTNTV